MEEWTKQEPYKKILGNPPCIDLCHNYNYCSPILGHSLFWGLADKSLTYWVSWPFEEDGVTYHIALYKPHFVNHGWGTNHSLYRSDVSEDDKKQCF